MRMMAVRNEAASSLRARRRALIFDQRLASVLQPLALTVLQVAASEQVYLLPREWLNCYH